MNVRRTSEQVKPRNNGLIANAGDVHLDAAKPPKAKQWNLAARYNRDDLATPQQESAITARYRLTADATFAKNLKVTEDQLKQLQSHSVELRQHNVAER